MESTLIDLKSIEIPEKYRRERSPKTVLENQLLAKSMKACGLKLQVMLMKKGDGYDVIDGGRRVEAARKLYWRQIPAYVVKTDDPDHLRFQLNMQRENLKPVDLAIPIIKAIADNEEIWKELPLRSQNAFTDFLEEYGR